MRTSARRSTFVVSLVLGLSLCGFLALASSGGKQRQSRPRAAAAKAKPTPRARAKRNTPPAPTPSPAAAAQRLPRRLPEAPEAYDSPREAAEFFRFKRLPAGATELPVEKYLEAQERMRLMPQYSTAEERLLPARATLLEAERAALPAWTPLGPNNVGGRTRALLIHPANPSVMYAASVAGGVWKTVNGGALWTPLAEHSLRRRH